MVQLSYLISIDVNIQQHISIILYVYLPNTIAQRLTLRVKIPTVSSDEASGINPCRDILP